MASSVRRIMKAMLITYFSRERACFAEQGQGAVLVARCGAFPQRSQLDEIVLPPLRRNRGVLDRSIRRKPR